MPTSRRTITVIAIFASLGLLLSGYLTYRSLWSTGCSQGFLSRYVSCGGPQKVLIFGLPTCVYGFFMFLSVFILNIGGSISARPRPWVIALLAVGSVGTAFSAGLTIYELFILKLTFITLPACVYGLVLYLGILGVTISEYKKQEPPLSGAARPGT